MKIQVHFEFGETRVNEVVEGANAEAIVRTIQQRVAQRAGFLVGGIIKAMTPLQFAREATKRYAQHRKEPLPEPESCEAFLQMGVEHRFVTVLEGQD